MSDSHGEPSQGSPDNSVNIVETGEPTESMEPEDPNKKEPVVVNKNDKDYLLGGRPPLITIISLSGGPIVSQLINAMYGIVTTVYISLAVGDKGLSAISTYGIFDSVGRSFGFFLSTSASATISALFGAGKAEDSHQLAADIIRMCVVFGAIVPAILLPTVKLAARWFGASEEIVSIGFDYILPLSACAVFSILYIAVGGILQSEGRTGLSAVIMIVALVLNMGVFGPSFLFGAHLGMKGAGWATVASEALTGIVITSLYFIGIFQVKPKLYMLISKPSPHLWKAIKIGLSTLLAQLSSQIPAIIVRKLMGMACVYDSYDEVMSAYICSFRYQVIILAVIAALTQGYIPSASYAYQAHRYRRYLWLTFHAVWMCFAWGVAMSIIMWVWPRELASLFSKSENFLRYSEQQISIVNGLSMILFGRYMGTSILQSLFYAYTSIAFSLINNLAFIIIFAYVMYLTHKTDPIMITWCYSISYMLGLVFGTAINAKPLYTIYKQSKTEDEEPPSKESHSEEEEEAEKVPEL